MNRRHALSAIGFGCAAFPLTALPSPADDTLLRIGVNPVDASGQAYYAQDLGMYAKAGLPSTDVQTMASGAAQAAAIAGGSIDISIANIVTLAQAHAKGLPFTLVAGGGLYSTNGPNAILMVAEGSPIQKAADLNGKVVAVSIVKSIADFSVNAWMEQNGGDYKSIRYIESPLSDMAPALVQGRIDAALVLEPFVPAARKTCRQIGKPYDAIAPRFLVAGYFATEDWARKHVDVVRRFQQAMRLAADWANANQDRSGEILVARAKLNPADVKQMVREQYQERLDLDLIQPVIDAAAKYGGIPHFPASELIFRA
jgi:NitT/TauT family transport system substrate-binding protein